MLVVDASLVVELSLDRIGERANTLLGGGELVAPPLLWSEVPSALSEMAFRGDISQVLAERGLNRFLQGEIGVVERRPDDLVIRAWGIAVEMGWAKTYDAEYFALARILECRLVTLDLRLRRGTDRLGIVVTPDEL
jgi:predicted nucleic acid-binding protein